MKHLWLIGMMGSGKSVVGARIAELTGRRLVDVDARIVRDQGRSIAEIFGSDGESAFRACESAAVADAAVGEPAVIAVGGGAVLREANASLMAQTGTVIYLAATPATLARRVGGDARRPLLAAGDPIEVLTGLLADREETYNRTSSHVIKTDCLTVDQIAEEAIEVWNGS